MQPVSVSWTCKFTRESPKDQPFCGGLMLFITIDRLKQASGKMFCQHFSTPALVLAQNDNRSVSDCSYILALFFKEISWCSYLLFFALCVSVLWHCRPISSSFGRGLEVLKVQRHCKHIAASRPQQTAAENQPWAAVCWEQLASEVILPLCFCTTTGT